MTLLRALLQCHVVLRSHRNSLFKICLRHFQQQSKTEGEERSSKAFKTVRKTRRRITCLCKRFNLSEIRNHCYFYDFVYICIWLIKKISRSTPLGAPSVDPPTNKSALVMFTKLMLTDETEGAGKKAAKEVFMMP